MRDRIDLNCDLGEIPQLVADGTDERVLEFITSANVACGGHAGDAATMAATVRAAVRHGVAVGAHPSYPDRPGFGRRQLRFSPADIERFVAEQVRALDEVARHHGVALAHVKPHGALYHAAGAEPQVARAVALGAARVRPGLVMIGPAGSRALAVWRAMGFATAGEAFADRAYEPDGSLRSRALEGAVLTAPRDAAEQAVRIARDGVVLAANGARLAVDARTICIHGDTPGVARIAQAVRERLTAEGIRLAPPASEPAA